MPPLKYGRSEMTKPLELSMGAENSNVISLAAPWLTFLTTMLISGRLS